LARDPDFASGNVDTGLIERELANLTAQKTAPPEAAPLAALATLHEHPAVACANPNAADPWATLGAFRLWDEPYAFASLISGDQPINFRITHHAPGHYELSEGDTSTIVEGFRKIGDKMTATIDGHTRTARTVVSKASVTIYIDDREITFARPDPLAGTGDDSGGGDTITAPMPGLVKLVNVAAGDAVSKGQPLIVMEAMKMEHTLTAPRDGTIAEVTTNPGDQVEEAVVLLELAPSD
jgi:3-methylcrotonyl-CoA carboxylase alpha subunit